MPHVIVKLWPGKSEEQKTRLAQAIAKDVMDILHYGEESISVAMEDVKSQDWKEKVYKPDIQENWDKLYKQPGYDVNDCEFATSKGGRNETHSYDRGVAFFGLHIVGSE